MKTSKVGAFDASLKKAGKKFLYAAIGGKHRGILKWEESDMFRVNNEGPLTITFRRKGEKHEMRFSGSVYVLDEETGHDLIHISHEELATDSLDLCHIPVITIGGKKGRQGNRAQNFLASNPTFQGALLLLPGSGNWDLDDGDLVFTSRAVMNPRHRVSGGRPEVQLTNFRFLRDGRYVADR